MKDEDVEKLVDVLEARMRARAALGDTNAPGTISNEGVVSTVPGQITYVQVPEPVRKPYEYEGNNFVMSVTIGATLNLGNYSNAKVEVTATDFPAARQCFKDEVEETVRLVQATLKKVQK